MKKTTKILALLLAAIIICLPLAACDADVMIKDQGGGNETDREDAAPLPEDDSDMFIDMMNTAYGLLWGGCAGDRFDFDSQTASVYDVISMGLVGGYFGNGGMFEAYGGLYGYFSDEDLSKAICSDPKNKFTDKDDYRAYSDEGNAIRLDAELSKWILENVLGISDIKDEGKFDAYFLPGLYSGNADYKYYFYDGYLYIEGEQLYAQYNKPVRNNNWKINETYDLGGGEYGFVLRNKEEYYRDYNELVFVKAKICKDDDRGSYWSIKNISHDHVCFDMEDEELFDEYNTICREKCYCKIITDYYATEFIIEDVDGKGADELILSFENMDGTRQLAIYTWDERFVLCGSYETSSSSDKIMLSKKLSAICVEKSGGNYEIIKPDPNGISIENTKKKPDDLTDTDFESMMDRSDDYYTETFPNYCG